MVHKERIAVFIRSLTFCCLILSMSFANAGNIMFVEQVLADPAAAKKVLAFPTAEGGGMYTTGARGALENGERIEVYRVTSLADSGVGTFRDAVSKPNRIIVFDVGGVITLESRLNIAQNNLTILGQTAPGDGICFYKNNVYISGENVICRYLRVRVGDESKLVQDGFEIKNQAKNVILDHCTISWGMDELLAAYGIKDVTVQWCMISEPLNESIHAKGAHGYASLWGGQNVTFHHNLIAHSHSRNPRIGSSETTEMYGNLQDIDALIDLRNNVIYNWGANTGYGGENGTRVNFINNYYKAGALSLNPSRIFQVYGGNKYQPGWGTNIYADGNHVDGYPDVTENNWLGVNIHSSVAGDNWNKADAPHDEFIGDFPVNTESAADAYESVLNGVGANLPVRDLIDTRITNDVRNKEGGMVNSQTESLSAIGKTSISQVYQTAEKNPADDTDGDGIPDAWEDLTGLDKNNPLDATSIGPEGYTWLEIYVNEMFNSPDAPIVTFPALNNNVVTQDDSVAFPAVSASSGTVKYYLGDSEVTHTFTADKPGTHYLSVVAGNGIESTTSTQIIFVKPKTTEAGWTHTDIGSPIKTGQLGGGYVAGFGSIGGASDSFSFTHKQVTGDFDLIMEADQFSKLANGIHTGLMVRKSLDANSEFAMASYEYDNFNEDIKVGNRSSASGTVTWEGMKDSAGLVVDPSINRAPKYVKISRKDDALSINASDTLINWEGDVRKTSSLDISSWGNSVYIGMAADSGSTDYNVSSYNLFRSVTSAEKTTPAIQILSPADESKVLPLSVVRVKVTPDGNVPVASIAFKAEALTATNSLAGNVVTFEQKVHITEETEIEIDVNELPVQKSYPTLPVVDKYEFTVSCIDENLGTASDFVNVYVSHDTAPWITEDIGYAETTTHVDITPDYTYKIYAPSGKIGDSSDKFGYMYQQFRDDAKMYYRHRIQGGRGAQFGVMIRESLAPDSKAFYFYSEREAGTNQTFKAMLRESNGGSFTEVPIDSTTTKLYDIPPGTAMYFTVEKSGKTITVNAITYNKTNENYTWDFKNEVIKVNIDIPDEYYMGLGATTLASTGTPSDYFGTVEVLPPDGKTGALFNLDYGIDHLWVQQSSATLPRGWTGETISGNDTGKLRITPNDNYVSNQYIYRKIDVSGDMLEGGFNVSLAGQNPGVSLYMRTKKTSATSSNAFRVTFSDGTVKYHHNNALVPFKTTDGEDVAYDVYKWYKVKFLVDTTVSENNCNIYLYEANAYKGDYELAGIAENASQTTSTTWFRSAPEFTNANRNMQALCIEPIATASGTYYIDDMYAYGYDKISRDHLFKVTNLNLAAKTATVMKTLDGTGNAIIYLASYDSEGRLIDVKETTFEFTSDWDIDTSRSIILNDVPTGGSMVKAFIWDSVQQPLSEPYAIN